MPPFHLVAIDERNCTQGILELKKIATTCALEKADVRHVLTMMATPVATNGSGAKRFVQ
jgi:hypothetical protein